MRIEFIVKELDNGYVLQVNNWDERDRDIERYYESKEAALEAAKMSIDHILGKHNKENHNAKEN